MHQIGDNFFLNLDSGAEKYRWAQNLEFVNSYHYS
jgi:hypothetical protein